MSLDANPYAAQDLYVPQQWHESYQRYTTLARSEGRDLDGVPFPRMIDMWWAALGIGVREGQRSPLGESPVKFADGAILGSDPWRITHLGLIALAEEGETVLDRPAEVIRIACEFAATGSALLVEAMAGHARPMKPLSTYLRTLLTEQP
jgi:hypothetical protein